MLDSSGYTAGHVQLRSYSLTCLTNLSVLLDPALAIPASIPPVIFNALIVGPEIAIFFSDSPATLPLIAWNAFTVGVGEVISCMILGVLFARIVESTPALLKAVRA